MPCPNRVVYCYKAWWEEGGGKQTAETPENVVSRARNDHTVTVPSRL